MPRGSLPAPPSWYNDDQLVYFNFLKMEWPGPVGTLRWSDYPDDVKNIDIEGAAFDWDGTHPFTVGQFEQGEQTALAVSDVIFGNADHYFSDLMANFDFGCRGVVLECWVGKFDKALDPDTKDFDFIGSTLAFAGVMDRAEVGDEVHVSIISYRNPLTAKFPKRRFSPDWGFNWIPLPNFKVENFGVSGTVRLPTRSTPTTTGGGGGDAPPPGDVGNNPSARTVIRAHPRGPRGTRTGPRGDVTQPGGPRDTKTVKR